MALASSLWALNRFGDARKIYRELLKHSGVAAPLRAKIARLDSEIRRVIRSRAPRIVRQAAVKRQRGRDAAWRGKHDAAEKLFRQSHRLHPTPGALLGLADARARQKDFRGARRARARALARATQWEWVRARALHLSKQGTYDLCSPYPGCRGVSQQLRAHLTSARGQRDVGVHVRAAAVSRDGRLFATGGLDGVARLRDTSTFGELLRIDHGKMIDSVAVDHRGRLLASASSYVLRKPASGVDVVLRVHDQRTGNVVLRWDHRGYFHLYYLRFDPNGRLLAAGGNDGAVRIFQVRSGRHQRLQISRKAVTALRFGPKGRILAAGSNDGRVTLWRLGSGRRWRQWRQWRASRKEISDLRFDPLTQHLAVVIDNRSVQLWSVRSGKRRRSLGGLRGAIATTRFGKHGRTFLALGEDRSVGMWSVQTGVLKHPVHTSTARKLAPVLGARRWLVWLRGKNELWDVVRQRPVRNPRGEVRLNQSAMFGPARRLLVASAGARVFFDLATGRPIPVPAADQFAISRNGSRIALAKGADVVLWSVASRKTLGRLRHPFGRVADLALSHAGGRLAIQDRAGRIRIWDTRTGKLRPSPLRNAGTYAMRFDAQGRLRHCRVRDIVRKASGLKPARSFYHNLSRLDPSGRWLAMAGKFTPQGSWAAQTAVELFDAKSGKHLRTIEVERGSWSGVPGNDDINALDFGPSGLLAAGFQGTVKLYRASSGRRAYQLLHRAFVTSISIGPRGQFLAAGCNRSAIRLPGYVRRGDPSIWIWDLKTGEHLATLVVTDTGEWLVHDTKGYVDASAGGRWLWKWHVPGTKYPWSLAWERDHVPGLLARLIRGDTAYRLVQLHRLVARVRGP